MARDNTSKEGATDQSKAASLEERITSLEEQNRKLEAQLEQQSGRGLPNVTRRQTLAGLAGGSALLGATGTASAASDDDADDDADDDDDDDADDNADGDDDDDADDDDDEDHDHSGDYLGQGVPVERADVGAVNTDQLYTSQQPDVILINDDGTYRAVGHESELASGSDAGAVAQTAYDSVFDSAAGGHFRFAPGTYRFGTQFHHYQTGVTVNGPGATIEPTSEFTDYLIKWGTDSSKSIVGDPSNQYRSYLGNLYIDGKGQSKGILMEVLLSSTLLPGVYVHKTDGPGIHVSNTVRHTVLFNPNIRYGGNDSTAGLEIGPRTTSSLDNDPSNGVVIFAPNVTFSNNTNIKIYGDTGKEIAITRDIRIYGLQNHTNIHNTYGRDGISDHAVEVLGAKNIKFSHFPFRHAPANKALVNIDTGPNGDSSSRIFFNHCQFNSNEECYAFRTRGVTDYISVTNCNIGETYTGGSDLGGIADWGGQKKWRLIWDNNTMNWKGDNPFTGVAPTVLDRDIETNAFEGWLETWNTGLGRRQPSKGFIDGKDVAGPNPPFFRYPQPVREWTIGNGSPSVDHTKQELVLPDASSNQQQVVGQVNQLQDNAGWQISVSFEAAPSSGVFKWSFLRSDSDPSRYEIRVEADGTLVLRRVDSKGNASDLTSGSISIDTNEHTVAAVREQNGDWTLMWDGSQVGSTTNDPLLPTLNRETRIVSAIDVEVRVSEALAY